MMDEDRQGQLLEHLPIVVRNHISDILSVSFHRHIGLRLSAIDAADHAVIVTFLTSEKTITPAGTLHGGITNALLDAACAIATCTTIQCDGIVPATLTSSFQMLGTVKGTGHVITIQAAVTGRTRRFAFARATASAGGRILAEAVLTKVMTTAVL
ncbi:hypothetical protein PYCC9005_003547 [Savitreella phatthalungensis]